MSAYEIKIANNFERNIISKNIEPCAQTTLNFIFSKSFNFVIYNIYYLTSSKIIHIHIIVSFVHCG